MQTHSDTYQCAVIGGGLAGLCLAIQLADKGISTVVFEKNQYPFHKVCGEYISMESWDFLTELGIPLKDLDLPIITTLGVSSEKGFMLNAPLTLGGFGISRYSIDQYLCELARKKGVVVLENCKVLKVETIDEHTFRVSTSKGIYTSAIVCGSYGKYTPAFAKDADRPASAGLNYIGVKYHIKTDLTSDRIELHNFEGGYCGISKVDKEAYCLCYLSTSEQLQKAGNDIKQLEHTILYKNPFLKRYFTESEFLFQQPLTISNISFHKKHTYQNNIFLIGDAAGSITPLCGNGMSMAMKASKLLAQLLASYFKGTITKATLIQTYNHAWNHSFSARIQSGYYLQYLFGRRQMTHMTLKVLDVFPALTHKIISLTHGNTF
ncbi:MAG: NAD(P)/FAD-dependent oxidoreductase [Cytophagales bacterium]|nr:NAD(P)/FAD-dependent oxidoreductase [Cytophaga sp.]